ncbi:MAG: anthranilate phosphoribosyltransferase [Acidimicrobiia bacterium]|nr:anthranilate phosphoribosyltransferase [Acidimicrobiia bacterium]
MTGSSAFDEAGGWPAILGRIGSGSDLDRDQAHAVMSEILRGDATAAQIGALLMGLAVKGESTGEMAGFVESMLAASEPLSIPEDALDIVGTGGSPHRRTHAVNASTMACIVAGAAGAVVCKHGNRRASSTSGSFDFLEALGIDITIAPADLERCVAEIGVGFAFARSFHPAMRFAGPVRAELGVPTVFNTLGPLAHPGRIKRQLVGVATEEKAAAVAAVLAQLGSHRAWVVTGAGGLDEVSTSGPSIIFDVSQAGIERLTVDLEDVGVDRVELSQVAGGSPADNVAIFERLIDGETGPHRDLVAINAGAGLVVAGLADDLKQGFALANEAIDSGEAKRKLERLRGFKAQVAAD